MVKVIYLAICTLWVQIPLNDVDVYEVAYLPRMEKAYLVDSPQECAVNLFSMNQAAKEKDGKFTAILLRIDLETGKQDTVLIPEIDFKYHK